MTTYNTQTALHYAAYRPSLHEKILDRCIPGGAFFDHGLDIGCGTGYSARALKRVCRHVTGVDPSEAMLQQARPQEGLIYRQGRGEQLPDDIEQINIVTLAGSLFYADIGQVAREICRVCLSGAIVIAYDFSVHLDELLHLVDIPAVMQDSAYDHTCNFDGQTGLLREGGAIESLSLGLDAEQAMHFLLSHEEIYRYCRQTWADLAPEERMMKRFQSHGAGPLQLRADIFYSVYRVGEGIL